MPKNPDPTMELTTIKGHTRKLDDWLTIFHMCAIVLPERPEAAEFDRLAHRTLHHFAQSDCRAAYVVNGTERGARRVLGKDADNFLCFIDPAGKFAEEVGITTVPALVHLRADTAFVDAAQGWDPPAWQRVADGLTKASHWTKLVFPLPGDPPPSPGWGVAVGRHV